MRITDLQQSTPQPVSHNPGIKKRMLIAPDQVKNLVYFSEARFPVGESAPAHHHNDMTEVFFIRSGSGSIEINGESYAMKPGQCITIEPGDVHELKNTGDEELVVLYFSVLS